MRYEWTVLIALCAPTLSAPDSGAPAVEPQVYDFTFVDTMLILPIARSWERVDAEQTEWVIDGDSRLVARSLDSELTPLEWVEHLRAESAAGSRHTIAPVDGAEDDAGQTRAYDLRPDTSEDSPDSPWTWIRVVSSYPGHLLTLRLTSDVVDPTERAALLEQVLPTFSAATSTNLAGGAPPPPYALQLGDCRATIPCVLEVALAKGMHELPGRDVAIDLSLAVQPLGTATPRSIARDTVARLAEPLRGSRTRVLEDAAIEGGAGHAKGALVLHGDEPDGARTRWIHVQVRTCGEEAVVLAFVSDYPGQDPDAFAADETPPSPLGEWAVESAPRR